jgi:pimeloyl-ACP methyl ester carboxylesterase
VVEAWEREDAAIAAGDPEGALEGQLRFWTPGGDDASTDRRLRDIAFENLGVYEIEDGLASRADPPVIGRLREISAPTLVVVGERDVPDIARMANRMTSEMPSATKLVIPGADHLPNVRAPETFNRLVVEFLREVVPQP